MIRNLSLSMVVFSSTYGHYFSSSSNHPIVITITVSSCEKPDIRIATVLYLICEGVSKLIGRLSFRSGSIQKCSDVGILYS
jgi:hypothetical protein